MAQKRPITAEDLLHFNWLGDPQISPDGAQVAFLRKVAGKRNAYETSIWTVNASSKHDPSANRLTKGPKDTLPRFLPDSRSLVFVRGHKSKPTQVCIRSAAGSVRTLTNLPEGSIAALTVSLCGRFAAYSFRATGYSRTKQAAKERAKSGASTPPLVVVDPWYRLDGDGVFGADRYRLRLLDLRTGSDREVYSEDTLGTFSFDFSPDGETIFVSTNRHPKALCESWHDELIAIDNLMGRSPPRIRVLGGLPVGAKTAVKCSPDGQRIAYAGRRGRDGLYSTDNLGLWVHDLLTGDTRCVTGKTDFCLMAASLSDSAEPSFGASFHWMPDSESLLMRIGWHGEGHIGSVDLKRGQVALHSFGAAEHQLGGISRDGSRLALLRATPTALPEVHVAEIQGIEFPLRRLSKLNDALLTRLDLVTPTARWVRSKDGTSVQCWCLRPPKSAPRLARGGANKGKSPAIIEVHGGPHAQYGSAFFHEFQFLAAQGWTVFYSNPRGSKGYGRDFCSAIRGAWGTVDWEDVDAVTRFAMRQPGVDRARVGIMGGSYGGYMANWAVAHSRAYRAAITDRCVSNIVSHCGSSDFPEEPNRYWKGSAFKDPAAMWRSSPIAHFDKVRTPMLIIHSEGDLRCNIEQGEQVHAALVVQGVPVRFVRYPRESSHGMSRAGPMDLRLHRLGEIRKWWERWFSL